MALFLPSLGERVSRLKKPVRLTKNMAQKKIKIKSPTKHSLRLEIAVFYWLLETGQAVYLLSFLISDGRIKHTLNELMWQSTSHHQAHEETAVTVLRASLPIRNDGGGKYHPRREVPGSEGTVEIWVEN